jgi:RNA polymerase sigma-70 factor (ECF subfamily)
MHTTETTRFWSVWLDHRPKLFKLSLHRMGGHRADAEDALSTAMLRALDAFEEQQHRLKDVEAWLARIVINTCNDLIRRRRRDAAASRQDEGEPDTGLEPPVPSPEQALLEHEQTSLLRQHVEALPAPLRGPCVLRFEQDLTSPDIARRLGLTPVNVRRRLCLAYRELRTALEAPRPRRDDPRERRDAPLRAA